MHDMTPTANPIARRLTLFAAFGAALLAAAAPVQAQVALPSIGQQIATPLGNADLEASQDGADACLDLASPSLPAVPALPVPVPVPTPYAYSDLCAYAGLDGVHADASIDARGLQTGTSADVDTSQQHEDAKGFVGSIKGFVLDLGNKIASWF